MSAVILKKSAVDSETRLKQGIFRMLFSYRFLGSLACSFRKVRNDKIGTMATDGKNLYYNEEFVQGMSDQKVCFVVGHETWHAALGHCDPHRIEGRDMMVYIGDDPEPISLWNIACDYVVNGILYQTIEDWKKKNKATRTPFMELPSDAFFSVDYLNKTSEWVYADLKKKSKGWKTGPKGHKQSSLSGTLVGGHITAQQMKNIMDDVEQRRVTDGWKHRLDKELITEKQMGGHLPDYLAQLSSVLLTEQKVDWRSVLQSRVSEMYKSIYRMNPPNKRFVHLNVILPSVTGENVEAVFAVDTSGSQIPYIEKIYGELNHVFNNFDSYEVTLIECDSDVRSVYHYSTGEDFTTNLPKASGGGGTDFRPIFKYANEMPEPPALLVVVTDGYGTFPTQEPDYDVLWIVAEGTLAPEKYPFGEVIVVHDMMNC